LVKTRKLNHKKKDPTTRSIKKKRLDQIGQKEKPSNKPAIKEKKRNQTGQNRKTHQKKTHGRTGQKQNARLDRPKVKKKEDDSSHPAAKKDTQQVVFTYHRVVHSSTSGPIKPFHFAWFVSAFKGPCISHKASEVVGVSFH